MEEVFSANSFIDYYNHTDKIKIGLYSLHTFYVEVYYDREANDVTDIKGISVDEATDPVLNVPGLRTLEVIRMDQPWVVINRGGVEISLSIFSHLAAISHNETKKFEGIAVKRLSPKGEPSKYEITDGITTILIDPSTSQWSYE